MMESVILQKICLFIIQWAQAMFLSLRQFVNSLFFTQENSRSVEALGWGRGEAKPNIPPLLIGFPHQPNPRTGVQHISNGLQ